MYYYPLGLCPRWEIKRFTTFPRVKTLHLNAVGDGENEVSTDGIPPEGAYRGFARFRAQKCRGR